MIANKNIEYMTDILWWWQCIINSFNFMILYHSKMFLYIGVKWIISVYVRSVVNKSIHVRQTSCDMVFLWVHDGWRLKLPLQDKMSAIFLPASLCGGVMVVQWTMVKMVFFQLTLQIKGGEPNKCNGHKYISIH